MIPWSTAFADYLDLVTSGSSQPTIAPAQGLSSGLQGFPRGIHTHTHKLKNQNLLNQGQRPE